MEPSSMKRGAPVFDAAHEGVSAPVVGRAAVGWRRRLFRGLVSLALVALTLFGAQRLQAYLVATKPVAPKRVAAERVRTVEIQSVRPSTERPTLSLYGQIVAGRTVDLRVLVGGEVTSVSSSMVDGGRVRKDAVLVSVDRFEYDGALVRARTELAEAEARIVETRARIELEQAARRRAAEQEAITERELKRLSTLQDKGATSDANLDASRLRMTSAMAAVEARDAQIKILEAQVSREQASLERLAWNVRKAERDIRNTQLIAPFDGIVSNVAAEEGRLVNVNDRVATLYDVDRLEVRFMLTDGQYGRLTSDGGKLEGRKVTVVWRGGTIVREVPGVIDRVSPVVASATGGFDVLARLDRSQANDILRPGAFVNVSTPDIDFRNVVRLPQSAVHPGDVVFRVGEDRRLVPIPVRIEAYDGAHVLLSGAFPDGAEIMTTRLADAGPGVLVRSR
jgi:RND family efflux transporter MFP subunit